MCGIAGYFGNINKDNVEYLTSIFNENLYERGPDSSGEFHDDDILLFHRRLSIIDINTGSQPLYLSDKTGNKKYALIANGEIYNYYELRKEFPESKFQTHSDSEIILLLYEKYKEKCINYIRGMYSFALYDISKKRLLLSRDPYGIKPLYYSNLSKGFIFASNINSLLATKLIKKEILNEQTYQLMQSRFSLTKQTIYKNIFRVLPGETLIIENYKIISKSLYNAYDMALQTNNNEKFSLKTLETQISDSVAKHLRSDVPVGLFFSGGIDSSIILYWMKQYAKQPFHLFIAGFPDSKPHDETAKAEKTANDLGAIIHKVDFEEKDFWDYLVKSAKAIDDPFIDPAMLPTYKLSEVARKFVKVVLCGEGGDEFFSGYRRHHKAGILGGILKKRHSLKGLFRDKEIFSLQYNNWHKPIDDYYHQLSDLPWSNLQKMQIIDSSFWLPNNLLTKLDRCTMANSIEGRTPFIDQELSPYAFAIKDKYKVKLKFAKWCLRQHLDSKLPQAEAFAKKQGFKLPIFQWIKLHQNYLVNYLTNHEAFSQIFNKDKLKEFLQEFDKKNETAIFGLIFYSLWYDFHFNNIDIEIDNMLINHVRK